MEKTQYLRHSEYLKKNGLIGCEHFFVLPLNTRSRIKRASCSKWKFFNGKFRCKQVKVCIIRIRDDCDRKYREATRIDRYSRSGRTRNAIIKIVPIGTANCSFYRLLCEIMGAWSYRILDWQHAARTSQFSSQKLSSILGVSHRQLQRHFQKINGLKLHTWLNELRLRDARHLLGGQLSIKEVAFLLSFKQHSHFTREFKKLFGITPEKFSRLHFVSNPQFKTAYLELHTIKTGHARGLWRL